MIATIKGIMLKLEGAQEEMVAELDDAKAAGRDEGYDEGASEPGG